MPAHLIVNADDFGLTAGINRAVEELHQAGVLTSATLMATGPAFDDAVQVARRNPTLAIGCHIVLTDGIPASAPATIRTLLGPDSRTFRPSLANFALAALRDQIDPDDVAREVLAQIHHLQRAGLTLTHADTHKHTHLFPAVLRPILRALSQTGIPAFRNPFEPRWSHRLGHGGLLRRTQITFLRHLEPRFQKLQHEFPRLQTTEGSVGISSTGDLTPATLTQLLNALPDHGAFELVTHPGYNDPDLDEITTRLRAHRDVEREALLTSIPRRLTLPDPPSLIHFGQLPLPIASR